MPTFEAYLASLTSLSVHTDPTLVTSHSEDIRAAAGSLEEMAEVRLPQQFILAVVDGIGWRSRQAAQLRGL